jgi:glycosyltransferase involved in cell wall biosynthesis
VVFRGHVPQQQLARELAAAEVFLHMSWEDTERLPNVVKEAMASRCICVVTETPGIEELVNDGHQGFVVAARDVKAAAERLHDVFGERVDVASMLNRAADHVAHHFNVIESMRSYRQRWQDALTRRRLGPLTAAEGLYASTPATPAAVGLNRSTHQ